jgi:hypothetical protein
MIFFQIYVCSNMKLYYLFKKIKLISLFFIIKLKGYVLRYGFDKEKGLTILRIYISLTTYFLLYSLTSFDRVVSFPCF